MLRQERIEDPQEALRLSLLGFQAEIWTALPGMLDSFDATKMTCVVQPTTQGVWRLKDGSSKIVTLPLCLDVPVCFPGGGGYTLTFPLKKNDEGLIVFASRCIDAWWQNGGVQPLPELRMHDLSDGFFFPGVRNKTRVLSNLSTTSVQLRADDASSFVDIAAGLMTLKHPTKVKVDSPTTEFTGDVVIDGKLSSADQSNLAGGAKAVVLDGDPVSGGVVHATSTKTKGT